MPYEKEKQVMDEINTFSTNKMQYLTSRILLFRAFRFLFTMSVSLNGKYFNTFLVLSCVNQIMCIAVDTPRKRMVSIEERSV